MRAPAAARQGAVLSACGVEPDQIDFTTMTAVAPPYHLNPEIFESTYYLFHYTGDARYLAMGRDLFDSLRAFCRTDSGYAELASIVTRQKADAMPSYFLAETMKYLSLVFTPAETLDFSKSFSRPRRIRCAVPHES